MGRRAGVLVLSGFLLIVVAPLLLAGATACPGFRGSLHRKKITLDDEPPHAGRQRSRRQLGAELTATDTTMGTNRFYSMELAIGTPPVTIQALVAANGDLCWVKCVPCSGCNAPSSPAARLYNRANSSSFSPLPCASQACKALPEQSRTRCTDTECGYRYQYRFVNGANDTADYDEQGILGTETVKFGGSNEAKQGFVFGCSDTSDRTRLFRGNTGVIGLGRSKLSLVSQLGLDRFSYCLSSNPEAASPILFGSTATMTGTGVSSTPLLYDDVGYNVNLLGISVDGTRLPIPDSTFVLDPKTGHGGVAFETSTPVTLLVDPAYALVVEAFTARMPAAVYGSSVYGSRRPCFLVNPSNVTVPAMTMHFEGMDVELPLKNYISTPGNNRRGDNVMCLMIGRSTTATSVIGSIMQMDFHVLYDLKNSVLSVQRADCSKV